MRAGPAALVVYALVIVYVSLTPFFGWRPAEAFTLFSWPKYWSIFDIGINALAYAPLGAMIAAIWRFRARRRLGSRSVPATIDVQAWMIGVGGAVALSFCLEYLQSFLVHFLKHQACEHNLQWQ